MQPYLFPIVAILLGGFFLIRNLYHFFNEDKMLAFLEINPKAVLLVKMFGREKAASLTRKFFIPVGCFLGAWLVYLGYKDLVALWSGA